MKYVIYDPAVCTKTDLKVFGVPDNHAFSLAKLKDPEKFDEDQRVYIEPGNSYMMIGVNCYKYINANYHLGLRKVTYNQVCTLPKVTTQDGINFTFCSKVLGTSKFQPRLDYFLSKEFNQHLRTLPEENKLITKDLKVAIEWLRNWIDGKWHESKYDGWFGLDYETADVTNLNHKDICGVGIASINRGIFIDFRFPRSEEEWKEFSKVYIEFCMKFRDRIFAYNTKFEFDRTNETFNEYVDFQDAGSMNVVDARQMIYYSLKFTAQYYLGVPSWDDQFDEFATYLHKEIFKNYKSLDALLADEDRMERFKKHFIDEDDFNEWVEIARMKPEYWGDRFWLQTSRNLGKYCILDSYHTVMIAVIQWPKYPELANVLTCDNLRLGSQLMATGCFLDDDKRDYYLKINAKYQCFAAFKILAAYYTLKIENVDQSFLDKLSPICKQLILKGLNPTKGPDFWKDAASLLIDEKTDSLINEYNAIYLLGDVVGNKLINFGRRYKKPLVNFTRSKKMQADLYRYRHMLYNDKDKELIEKYKPEISKINSNKTYSKRLDILKNCELWNKEFDDVGIDDTFEFGGKVRTLGQIANTLIFSKKNRNGWFKLGSSYPKEQKILRKVFLNVMNGYPCAYASNLYTKLKYVKKFLRLEDIQDPEAIYKDYLDKVKVITDLILEKYKSMYKSAKEIDEDETPLHLFDGAELTEDQLEDITNLSKLSNPDNIRKFAKILIDTANKKECKLRLPDPNDYHSKEYGDLIYDRLVNCAHSGFSRWSKCESYPLIKHRTNIFGFEYGESTPYEIVSSTIKALYMVLLYEKEAQYLNGIFYKDRHKVNIIDKDLRIKRDKEGEYTHIDTKFNICRLKTKRSSSGFHTIPHASCIKGIIKAPKGYAMSYFDVSQAEPRTAAYLIDKAKMRECYENGQDLYHLTAALMHNMSYEEWVQKPEAKRFRANFKTCLLGLLYGMGADTLGGRIGEDADTARVYIKALFDTFPELKKGIEYRKEWPLTHHRECLTFWGDKMYTDLGDDATKRRYGINYPIQGNTSIALTAGFYNVVRQCEDAHLNIRPVLAIHDALVCYFPVEQLWELNPFYTHNFTDYLFEKTKVKYKFSVNYGTDYFNMVEMINLNEEDIQMEGSNQAIMQLMERLDEVGFKYEIVEQKSEFKIDSQILMKRYNAQYGECTSYDEDVSRNKVVLRRISKCSYNVPKYV
jgi:hypothetical protein